MGPVLGAAIFVILWWVVLFAVLPWGVRTQHEEDSVVPGSDPGAPVRPMLWRKAGITTVIAALLWLGLYVLLRHPPAGLAEFLGGKPAWITDQPGR